MYPFLTMRRLLNGLSEMGPVGIRVVAANEALSVPVGTWRGLRD